MSVELHHQDKFRGPNDRNGQEGRTASLCQISSKSLEPRRRRGDFSIFQTRQISWRSVKPLPKYRIFRSRGSSWACERENITGQEREKVTISLYFVYLW